MDVPPLKTVSVAPAWTVTLLDVPPALTVRVCPEFKVMGLVLLGGITCLAAILHVDLGAAVACRLWRLKFDGA